MKKKDIYRYPAVFASYAGGISITFPDFPGCVSHGDTDDDAFTAAKEALSLHLFGMEEDNEPIPEPTGISEIRCSENEHTTVIEVFMPAIRMAEKNKSVNRTVTLPAWLNAKALERNVNFSQVLQSTLIEMLGK